MRIYQCIRMKRILQITAICIIRIIGIICIHLYIGIIVIPLYMDNLFARKHRGIFRSDPDTVILQQT